MVTSKASRAHSSCVGKWDVLAYQAFEAHPVRFDAPMMTYHFLEDATGFATMQSMFMENSKFVYTNTPPEILKVATGEVCGYSHNPLWI